MKVHAWIVHCDPAKIVPSISLSVSSLSIVPKECCRCGRLSFCQFKSCDFWVVHGPSYNGCLPSHKTYHGNPSGEWQHSFCSLLFIYLIVALSYVVFLWVDFIMDVFCLSFHCFLLLDQHDSSDRITLTSCRTYFQIVDVTWHKHLACHYVAGLCLLLTLCVCVW